MKALVVYGTRYGTATEIAEEIARTLKGEGVETDLLDSRGLKDWDVTPYDLVIVGSGIKIGKWTKGARKFLDKNKSALAERKVALFVSCGAANKEESRGEGQEKYLDDVAQKHLINDPVATGLFGSTFDPNSKQGFLYKQVMKSIKKDLEKQGIDVSKPVDCRDWDEIRAWTRALVD